MLEEVNARRETAAAPTREKQARAARGSSPAAADDGFLPPCGAPRASLCGDSPIWEGSALNLPFALHPWVWGRSRLLPESALTVALTPPAAQRGAKGRFAPSFRGENPENWRLSGGPFAAGRRRCGAAAPPPGGAPPPPGPAPAPPRHWLFPAAPPRHWLFPAATADWSAPGGGRPEAIRSSGGRYRSSPPGGAKGGGAQRAGPGGTRWRGGSGRSIC